MKYKGLKALIVNKNTLDKDNNSQDFVLYNDYEIIKEDKSLPRNNSCYNIFSKLNLMNIKKNILPPIIKEEDKKESLYKIERGIIRNASCLISPNKFYFGKAGITILKYIKNGINQNIITKKPEQKQLSSTSYLKSIIHLNNIKKIGWTKRPKIKKQKNNVLLNNNKTNYYIKYNNGRNDRHILLNKSCPNIKKAKKDCLIFLKEEIPNIYSSINNYNQISNNENIRKNSSLSTMEQTNIRKGKKIINSSFNFKKDSINNISDSRKLTQSIRNKKKYFLNMSKYHLVINDYLIKENDINHMPKEIINFNKNAFNSLKKENEKLFFNYISAIPPHKFSSKFIDPLNTLHILRYIIYIIHIINFNNLIQSIF